MKKQRQHYVESKTNPEALLSGLEKTVVACSNENLKVNISTDITPSVPLRLCRRWCEGQRMKVHYMFQVRVRDIYCISTRMTGVQKVCQDEIGVS
jgi:hypothetical protein